MKYFVISDVHSFYLEMLSSLKESGFDKKNPNHTLIVCGDIFDRGDKSVEVYKFLKSIPKKRCILITGNHEQLYFQLLNKKYPESHDFSNGTVRTFCQIAAKETKRTEFLSLEYDLRRPIYYEQYRNNFIEIEKDDKKYILDNVQSLWNYIKDIVKNSEITKWLQSKQWVNYYELDKYIFVHSFIPLKWIPERGLTEDYCIYYGWIQMFESKPNWRESTLEEWQTAAWGCAYKFFDAGFFDEEIKKDKVLVCGHYRCSEFNKHYLGKEIHDIYFGKNLIAIDCTTALTFNVNVLIINGDKCYDQRNDLLEVKERKE